MYHPGMRSPDSMRPQPRQPPISPHDHQPSYGASSRGGDGASERTRSRQRPPTQRAQDQVSWPNPWLRCRWDPENPLDLNKTPEEPQDDPEAEKTESARPFETGFTMDLNDLVQSLWTPAKPPPPPSPQIAPQYTSRRERPPVMARQRSGSPPPPQPGLPAYTVPTTVRDVRRPAPRYDDRPMPDDFASRTWRLDDPRAAYDVDPRVRRAMPPRDIDPWFDDDEDPRYRRYVDQPPQYDDARSRRPAYDPRLVREYADREYEQPPPRRFAVPPQYDRYEPRYDDDDYNSPDDYSRRAPGIDPRMDPRRDPYYDDRIQQQRRMDPRYLAELEAMRYQEELERRWIAERLRVDRRMHEAARVDPRMNRSDPRIDPRLDPRLGPRFDPSLDPRQRAPLRRVASDHRTDPLVEPRLRRMQSDPRERQPDPRSTASDEPLYVQYRDPRAVRTTPSPQHSSHFSSPHSSSSSSSYHPSYKDSPSSQPRIVSSGAGDDRDSIDSVEF